MERDGPEPAGSPHPVAGRLGSRARAFQATVLPRRDVLEHSGQHQAHPGLGQGKGALGWVRGVREAQGGAIPPRRANHPGHRLVLRQDGADLQQGAPGRVRSPAGPAHSVQQRPPRAGAGVARGHDQVLRGQRADQGAVAETRRALTRQPHQPSTINSAGVAKALPNINTSRARICNP